MRNLSWFPGQCFTLLNLSLVWWLSSFNATGQALDKTLFTTGTVTVSPTTAEDWGYLAFQIDDPERLRARKLAIYSKPGAPDSIVAFTRQAVVTVQTNPIILKVLIERAAHLGESASALEGAIDEIFASLIPDPSLTLPQKLSAVIQGTLNDAEQYASLVFLSRTHPAVALALGLAHGQPIAAGMTTFEVREFDLAKSADLGVVGRVTVTAGQPVVLPMPGRAVEVPDVSVMGHLNAGLRWGTPLDLRRLALLHFGYNLYRVPRAYAESTGMDQTPPDAGILSGLATQQSQGVKRINNVPIMAARVMTEIEAADLILDPKTAFLSDDNGLSIEDAVPFQDGEAFYYFVTARDLLGRDGLVSPGTLVVMQDRVPPSAPRGVVVENDYRYEGGEPIQRLRVTWKQRPNDPENPIAGYYVHRWSSPGDVATLGGVSTLNRISPLIPHVLGEPTQTFLDETPGAPTAPDSYDHTIYYTVRAVEINALSNENLSANSAPASGVLRDREAPEGPTGGAVIACCNPSVEATTLETSPLGSTPDAAEVVLDLVCTSEAPAIAFADFFIGGTQVTAHHARVHFRTGSRSVHKRVRLRRANLTLPLEIHCRVGSVSDQLSSFAAQTIDRLPDSSDRQRVVFHGSLDCSERQWSDTVEASGCGGHDPHPLGQGGEGSPGNAVKGIKLKLNLKETTREWRLYRRVDAGKLTLLRQGRDDFKNVQEIEIIDQDLPSSSATIAYFGQLLDQNGNASQLALLGKAVPLRQAPPAPMQAPVSIGGTPGNPTATIRWFCPPQGVERFEILVHVDPGSAPTMLSTQLGENHHTTLDQLINGPVDDEESETLTYGAYYTPQLGAGFGNGPEFQISFPMTKSKTYLVQVAARAVNGGKRTLGNVQKLSWQGGKALSGVPVPGTPNVPWPELLPPEPSDAWHASMTAEQIALADFQGAGVRVGELTADQVTFVGGETRVKGSGTLKSALYLPDAPVSSDDTLLPLVLYRYQVPSSVFPTVSGDLIQVTPLMEKIAVAEKNDGGVGPTLSVRDPFVRVVPIDSQGSHYHLYLIDTQPVMRRATYGYVAVRFGKDGEIASVHPIAPVHIQ